MHELWSIHATQDACDIAMRGRFAGRVATDEVFLAGSLPGDLRAAIVRVDPDALIRETTEGWEEVVLTSEEARAVWAALSQLAPPASPAYVQGDVARVGVRAFAREDDVVLYVRAPCAHHLRARIDAERGRR